MRYDELHDLVTALSAQGTRQPGVPEMMTGAPPATPGCYDTDGFEIVPQTVFDVCGQLMLGTTYTPGQPGNPTKTTNPPPKQGF